MKRILIFGLMLVGCDNVKPTPPSDYQKCILLERGLWECHPRELVTCWVTTIGSSGISCLKD